MRKGVRPAVGAPGPLPPEPPHRALTVREAGRYESPPGIAGTPGP